MLHQFFLDNKKAPDKGRGQPNVFTTYLIYFRVVSIVVADYSKVLIWKQFTTIGTKYERKCPDLKVGNIFYEFESFEKPWNKRKIKNMISHGMEQSSYIIDNTKGCSDRYIRRMIANKARTSNIQEVWLYEKGTVRLVYKNKKTER